MKADELMIGDLIHCITDNKTHRILRLNLENDHLKDCELYKNEENKLNYLYDVEPIPLTGDILEANGFRYIKGWQNSGLMYMVGNRFKINFANGMFYIWHWCQGYCQKAEVHCKYVHELQHALRLCGLNELTDNFVILNNN